MNSTESKTNLQIPFPQLEGVVRNTENAYTNMVAKVRDLDPVSDNQPSSFQINKPNIIRGGLMGVAISALLTWNAGKYSRLGIFWRRWQFIRNFIIVNRKPECPQIFTNYYSPPLDAVVKNFMCYSGEPGIGKSTHFMNLAYTQSGVRPALYISFKSSGKDATFEEDIAEQIGYGGDCPGILAEIIRAVKRIDRINKRPQEFWFKNFLVHIMFGGLAYAITVSSIEALTGMLLFSSLGISYIYYLNFIYPFFIQSFRRTCPLIIFDDLNKIQHINMLPEVVRYIQLLDNNMANVILVSPDEGTWSKLRREPGVKDRLRVRQIYYNHIYTSEAILKFIANDHNAKLYLDYINGNKLFTKEIVVNLIKELIGKKQVTLRRFSSILILNDEEKCEKLIKVLVEYSEGKINKIQAVDKFTNILFLSEAATMVANLKSIKREVKMPDDQFISELKLLFKKRKLPSDHQIGTYLKEYNIVRDLQSEYVLNGRFMSTILKMGIQKYEEDMKEYQNLNEKSPSVLNQSRQDPGLRMPLIQPSDRSPMHNEMIKNWNKSNVIAPDPTPSPTQTPTQSPLSPTSEKKKDEENSKEGDNQNPEKAKQAQKQK